MAENDKFDFKFPDELEESNTKVNDESDSSSFEIEIEDDTPPEDRGRKPVPQEFVKNLEVETDDLDKYSKDAKDKLIQMKRVWHDERREKEAAQREQQQAVTLAQRLLEENKRIKGMLQSGGQEYANTLNNAANLELQMAKNAYKQAYESGDTDAIVEAQNKMQQANLRLLQAQSFKMPPLQEEKFEVQTQQEQVQAPRADRKAQEWQERNPWFGQDEEMTAAALGLHRKLERQGVAVGSEAYYSTLDKTMRRRFPESFDEPVEEKSETRTKPSTVVAPATRSTASKVVKMKQSEMAIAKKLGLTPQQYADAKRNLENQ